MRYLLYGLPAFLLLLNRPAVSQPVFPGAAWESKSPVETRLDAAKLDQLADQLGGRGCVIKDGYVVKTWGDQAQRGDWFSSAKPVLSTMLFFAVEEGLAKSVDQRIADFGWELKAKDRAMTFRHLGAMTSAYARPEPPGAAWAYNDYAIQLYQKTLFDKVYKADPKQACEDPKRLGALQLQDGLQFSNKRRISASVRDWARLCWFWMNRGKWGERQVLPRHYFDEYMKPQVPAELPFSDIEAPTDDYLKIGSYGGESFRKAKYGPGIYGFNWWFNGFGPRHLTTLTWPDAPPDTVMSLGFGGNSAAMIPSLGLIVVCADGAWDDLKPGNPASKINQALKLAAEAAGYHPTQPAATSPEKYFPPSDAEGGWRSLATAEQIRRVAGMDKQVLDEAYHLAEGSSTNGALLVVRHGWLAYERYFGRGHREALCNLASCGKSFTSIAMGVLMAERPELFPDGLDQKVFTPTYLPSAAFPLSDPAKADIKLGELLCFSAGIRGNNPCYVDGRQVMIEPIGPDGYKAVIDAVAFGKQDLTNRGELVSTKTLWCKPGGGYSYATASAHLGSVIVRHVSGMELEDYVRTRLAKPMGWGQFTYAYKQYPAVDHTPGGGGIALRPTDMLRFGYLLLREGRWQDRQLVPAEYVRQCGQKSPYNPHYPYSLQFNVNADGTLPGAPRDMYFKGGAGGHVLWIVPSLDLVVWRLAGRDDQYDESNTGVPLAPEILKAAESRKGWKPTVSRSTAESQIITKVIEAVGKPQGPTEQHEKAVLLRPASPPVPERAAIAGVPFGRGRLTQPDGVVVEAGSKALATQATVSSRWPDHSIRALLLRFQLPKEPAELRLRLGTRSPAPPNPFEISQTANGITLANGLLQLKLLKAPFALFHEVKAEDSLSWSGDPDFGNVRITDGVGRSYALGSPDRLEVEESGPVQAVVVAEGPFQGPANQRYFRYRIRYFLAARSPLVRVELTFINDLLAEEFQPLTSIELAIPLAGEGALRGQLAGDDPGPVERELKRAIRQVSDHRLRRVAGETITESDERSPGWAVVERGPARVAFTFRDFWQTWPKGISLEPDGIHVQVLPSLAENEYLAQDLQDWLKHYYWFSRGKYHFKRGMPLRVEFHVRFGRTSEPAPVGGWGEWARTVQTAPYAAPPPDYCCATGVFGPVLPASTTVDTGYERLVEQTVAGMARGREEAGEYGWMNYGDWYGERRYNWGNNEYDWPWAMALHFARTGRWDYLLSGEAMARHSITIDTVRIPWTTNLAGRAYIHCVGHVGLISEPPASAAADTSWEKFRAAGGGFVKGGIDSSGHIFDEGRFAMYLLTGDRDLLQAAENSTGAQAEYLAPHFDFHIERGAGWPLINAVAAYETTGKPLYLTAARRYIARILEKQDPQNGGWMLPQDPKECSHPPPHLGGKPFAAGVLLYGMMRYDLVEPTLEVKHSIVHACDWLVREGWNAQKKGFRYKTGCPDFADSADSGGCIALCSAGLAYGWKLTGNPRYAEVLTAGFAAAAAREDGLGKGRAMMIRQSAFALPALREIQQAASGKVRKQ